VPKALWKSGLRLSQLQSAPTSRPCSPSHRSGRVMAGLVDLRSDANVAATEALGVELAAHAAGVARGRGRVTLPAS
jgi:hypothetical protein